MAARVVRRYRPDVVVSPVDDVAGGAARLALAVVDAEVFLMRIAGVPSYQRFNSDVLHSRGVAVSSQRSAITTQGARNLNDCRSAAV